MKNYNIKIEKTSRGEVKISSNNEDAIIEFLNSLVENDELDIVDSEEYNFEILEEELEEIDFDDSTSICSICENTEL